MNKILYITILLFFSSLSTAAQADCIIRGPSFFPTQNDSINWEGTVSVDGRCERAFGSGGRRSPGLVFQGVQVVKQASNGSVRTNGTSGFIYQAKQGFKGTDRFTVKQCATGNSGSGCSTINVALTVQ